MLYYIINAASSDRGIDGVRACGELRALDLSNLPCLVGGSSRGSVLLHCRFRRPAFWQWFHTKIPVSELSGKPLLHGI